MHKRRAKLVFAPFTILVLLAQLVLTAAHLHRGIAHGGQAGGIAVVLAQGNAGAPNSPIDGNDGYCALCWAQTVVGSLPIPPALPLPVSHAGLSGLLSASGQNPTSSFWPGAFQPRAPPPSLT
jgi:hypothetical protein